MGIILLPYFFGIFFIIAFSLKLIIKDIKLKKLQMNDLISAFFISILFLIFIHYIYSTSERIYAFGPFFFIPLVSIIIPFVVSIIIRPIKYKIFVILNSSVIITTILIIIFFKYFDVIERYNLETYH